MKNPFLTLLAVLLSGVVSAQSDSASNAVPERSYGKFSTRYTTNDVYNGRRDSLSTPYVVPSLGYYSRSGFYAEAALSFLTRPGESRLDLTTLSAGYDYSKGNFGAGVYAEKYIFNNNSSNTRSEVKGDLSGQLSYDFGFIETTAGAGINFSQRQDITVNWSFDHEFSTAKGKLKFDPTAEMNASTRNYYASWYQNRKFRKARKKLPNITSISASVLDASKLAVMDYAISLPVEYKYHQLGLSFTPFYVIPVHPADVTIQFKQASGNTIIKHVHEQLSSVFYGEFTASLRF